MKVGQFLKTLSEIVDVRGSTDIEISSIAYDSRKVEKGSLFIAIQGFKLDGHDYIREAVSNGAVAVIGEKEVDLSEDVLYIKVKNSRKALSEVSSLFFGKPAERLNVIGVTGTNGKTTTTYLIKAILDEAGYSTGVVGTIGIRIKDRLLPAERTTPESLELNQIFSEMLKEGVEYVAMEVSSHSLKLHRVDHIKFEVGVFTNLTQDHLDFHASFEDYYASKKKLFDLSRKAVINVDDESGERLCRELNIPVLTYAVEKNADVRAENVAISSDGVSYDVCAGGKRRKIVYRVPGRFSVYNSLAAISACLFLGIDLDTMTKALEKVRGVPGRFEPVDEGQNFTVIVDYAHTPDGLENVLNAIKTFARGRIITVFGAGGDRDRGKRPLMGRVVSEHSDYFIITSDNPRTEDPQAIIDDIEKGIMEKSKYEKVTDRREAIKRAIEMASGGDVILIAGKGHEDYQIIGDKILPFDDREVVREFLRQKGRKR
ncbi:UDP-N-acetylmuramoyl-L-alanyl-D-glutamate--2,6-diaminopimelate ligase [Thermosediminibacter litoriperuensis]|uniref:UDP-N-acetylmuramoyl-L-alanyl-D-glutamate--2,6-diaminopimelate ligase n=1 Tax=Thermosediminibacter litoriperuensis TaxID=291989 RepID=A0A5S5ASD9_9FIRM|nr:UDP-N-acetylmuramoyl-L-alanyl-D-glutamate--2,6-diaminopimelate ligase [Thermosediminibacter litoriperuensis]TYP54947.1 UDP-N-acetylmuramoylalanyl-D-glutamate--2,6-diaminopimelate ligase [Thermosediminibacter litoriperuensis]